RCDGRDGRGVFFQRVVERLVLLVVERLVLLVGERLVLLVGERLVLLVDERLVLLVGARLVLCHHGRWQDLTRRLGQRVAQHQRRRSAEPGVPGRRRRDGQRRNRRHVRRQDRLRNGPADGDGQLPEPLRRQARLRGQPAVEQDLRRAALPARHPLRPRDGRL